VKPSLGEGERSDRTGRGGQGIFTVLVGCLLGTMGLTALGPALSGVAASDAIEIPFDAPPTGWAEATRLDEEGTGSAAGPNVAAASGGRAIAVFWADTIWDTNESIYASQYVPGSGWSTPVPYPTYELVVCCLQVASDRDGNAMATWGVYNLGSRRSTLWANRFSPNSGWENASKLGDCGLDSCYPQIAMDPAGNTMISWYDETWNGNDVQRDLFVIRFVPGSGWEPPFLLASNGGYTPQLAADASGNVIAVWPARLPGARGSDLYVRHFAPGSGWGNATVIEPANLTEWEPKIAMSPDGSAMVVWTKHLFLPNGWEGNQIWAKRFVPDSGWGPSIAIDDGSATSGFPDVAVDETGNAVATWRQGGAMDIWANRYDPASGWEAPTNIENVSGHATFPRVAFASNGNAVVAWDQVTSCCTEAAYANTFVVGIGWDNATMIGKTTAESVGGMELAGDGNGNVFATWGQCCVPATVWANQYATEKIPPAITITSPPSGTLLLTNSTDVSWDASDVGSGLDYFTIGVDDADPVALPSTVRSHTLTGLLEGAHAVNVTAYDVVGNFASDVVTVTVDTLPPDLAIDTPENGSALAAGTVTVGWTSSDSGIGLDHFEIGLDDGPASNVPSTERTFTLDGVVDGDHVVSLAAFDGAGHSRTVSIRLTVDTAPPRIEIVSPSDGALLTSDDIAVAWTSSDDMVGLRRIEVSLDGTAPTVLPPTSTSITLVAADGQHSIAVRAVDGTGNTATDAHTVMIDTTPPVVSITDPASGAVVASPFVTVSWTFSDSASGVEYLSISLDGGTATLLSNTVHSFSLADLSDGLHAVTVTAIDRAGHSASSTVTFRVADEVLVGSAPSGDPVWIGIELAAVLAIGAVVLVEWRRRRSSRDR
jgi:hypothetical protein